ncbi:MAG: TMEM175 family protein [Actinobacteria bacterium]|nr:TMEM175 family protein [Actinomycetota bacterium]
MKDIRTVSREAKTNRIETLSDGVFAIVMTILVLELTVPDIQDLFAEKQLGLKLLEMWPKFTAYAFSFIVLGLLWSFHHYIFQYIKRINSRIIWINIIFLMFISLLPFSTAMIGKYAILSTTAVVFYGTNCFLNILNLNILWWYVTKNSQLLINDITSREIMQIKISFGLALGLFLISIGLSFVNLYIGLIIYFLLIVWGIIATIRSKNIRLNFKKN